MKNINSLQAISTEQTLTRNTLEYEFTKSVQDIASINFYRTAFKFPFRAEGKEFSPRRPFKSMRA
jgi:hypothetical protein